MNKGIYNGIGWLLCLIGVMAFAYAIASPFVAPLWVTAILAGITALLLAEAFKLWDIAEAMDNIRTNKHRRDLEGARTLINLYADKYHDKDAEYAKEHIEALDDIIKNEDYHIQRVRDLYRMQVQTESEIIDIAGKIRKANGADKR